MTDEATTKINGRFLEKFLQQNVVYLLSYVTKSFFVEVLFENEMKKHKVF